MILTSTSRFFVVHGVDSGQGHFTDSFVVSKSSRPTRVLKIKLTSEMAIQECVCAALLSSNRLLHTQEDVMFHTEEKQHMPNLIANLH